LEPEPQAVRTSPEAVTTANARVTGNARRMGLKSPSIRGGRGRAGRERYADGDATGNDARPVYYNEK
jgi:hypothetical protein